MLQYHHIKINGGTLCEKRAVDRRGIPCSFISEAGAKSGVLRLIEQNPVFPLRGYKVLVGRCPGICPRPEDTTS